MPTVPDYDSPSEKRRRTALSLAVDTAKNSRQFTVGMVVQTADAYEKYLRDGTVPPVEVAPRQVNVYDKKGDDADV